MTELNERMCYLLEWHIKNPSTRRDFDNETVDQAWSKGYDSGYDSGRIALIKEIIGLSEYDRIVTKVKNENR